LGYPAGRLLTRRLKAVEFSAADLGSEGGPAKAKLDLTFQLAAHQPERSARIGFDFGCDFLRMPANHLSNQNPNYAPPCMLLLRP
jgi:hypothetical protein